MNTKSTYTNEEALRFHSTGRPGKLEIVPVATDLQLADA